MTRLEAAMIIIIGTLVALAILDQTSFMRDDTDGDIWTSRSGMSLRTDNRTGCQYLVVARGGITPRVDGAGKHVGCKEK